MTASYCTRCVYALWRVLLYSLFGFRSYILYVPIQFFAVEDAARARVRALNAFGYPFLHVHIPCDGVNINDNKSSVNAVGYTPLHAQNILHNNCCVLIGL